APPPGPPRHGRLGRPRSPTLGPAPPPASSLASPAPTLIGQHTPSEPGESKASGMGKFAIISGILGPGLLIVNVLFSHIMVLSSPVISMLSFVSDLGNLFFVGFGAAWYIEKLSSRLAKQRDSKAVD